MGNITLSQKPISNISSYKGGYMIKINTYKAHTDKGISTRDLEKLTGISKSTLNNIDTGKTSPNLRQLEAIAKALDLKITDLFDSEYK